MEYFESILLSLMVLAGMVAVYTIGKDRGSSRRTDEIFELCDKHDNVVMIARKEKERADAAVFYARKLEHQLREKCSEIEHWTKHSTEWMGMYRSAEQSNKWLNPLMKNYQRLRHELSHELKLSQRLNKHYTKCYDKQAGTIRQLELQLGYRDEQLSALNSKLIGAKQDYFYIQDLRNTTKQKLYRVTASLTRILDELASKED